uniref:BZIP domain-containing protein n=1 Tax=Ditylenchus dipsaci TaxID=166011 RepID=A0A915E4N3_9BILA
MEIDASLDKYLWEAAAWAVCKEEQDECIWRDSWSAHSEEEQELNLKDSLEEQELWSPGLPILDGLVPENGRRKWWNKNVGRKQRSSWSIGRREMVGLGGEAGLQQSSSQGYLPWIPGGGPSIPYSQIIPLARHWPRSVAFVGSEGSSRISQLFHGQDWHHQEQQHVQYPLNIPTSNDNDVEYLPSTVNLQPCITHKHTQYEPSNLYLPPNNEFEHLLNIGEDVAGPSHFSYNQQQQPQANLLEPLSAPQSIYSSSSESSWNQHDSYTSDSLSQDEILQEIHRECAQIEERNSSASPSSQAPSSSKARVVRSHARAKREEPYALSQSKIKSKKHTTPSKASLSPQSSRQMDSPASGGEKKKELNRIAATKYREKKRIEKESAVLELKGLEGRNTELKTQCSAMEAEIKYLKGGILRRTCGNAGLLFARVLFPCSAMGYVFSLHILRTLNETINTQEKWNVEGTMFQGWMLQSFLSMIFSVYWQWNGSIRLIRRKVIAIHPEFNSKKGCKAHAIDLAAKDICGRTKVKDCLNYCVEVAKFFRAYKTIRDAFSESKAAVDSSEWIEDLKEELMELLDDTDKDPENMEKLPDHLLMSLSEHNRLAEKIMEMYTFLMISVMTPQTILALLLLIRRETWLGFCYSIIEITICMVHLIGLTIVPAEIYTQRFLRTKIRLLVSNGNSRERCQLSISQMQQARMGNVDKAYDFAALFFDETLVHGIDRFSNEEGANHKNRIVKYGLIFTARLARFFGHFNKAHFLLVEAVQQAQGTMIHLPSVGFVGGGYVGYHDY